MENSRTLPSFHVVQIKRGARASGQRTGQYLFNQLPNDAASHVAGSLFDPFHKDLTTFEIQRWIDDHMIFNETGKLICIFNNDEVLWEDED